MIWTAEHDREFAETFSTLEDQERFSRTVPRTRRDDPMSLFEVAFYIGGALVTLIWAALLGLAGWAVLMFLRGLVLKLF